MTENEESVPPEYVRTLFDIRGQVVAVTGGGSGLGSAFALGFAQAGAKVAVLDVADSAAASIADEIQTAGGAAIALHCDVTGRAEVEGAAAAVAEQFGGIDILINSAGTAFRCAAEDFPEERYDLIIDLNLKGTYLSCQAFGRLMLAAGHGSIINIASIGSFAAYPLASAYQASKGGVLQLTRALALEWRTRGVRVNGIAPTLMDSPLSRAGATANSVTSDFIMARMLRPRLGKPRELLGAAIFLASDASDLVTGHTIMCDDGYTIA